MNTTTISDDDLYLYERWSRLRGAEVEVRARGRHIRRGFVDIAMPDDSALWLAADGAEGRVLIEAAAGYEVWVSLEILQTLS
ncbi:hypothetical protein ACIQTW_11980 [Paenarthrobacter sp. NPDC090517]|uniref:hypothetical protein n=1 Tax=Paenarthrobacter sp. NPDC090517 TaxID=3364381 RepID=UPI0037F930E9